MLLNPESNNYSTLNILSVPLLVKLTFDYGKVRPYISGGPRADILLSKNDGLITGQYDNINKVNFGMAVLAGAEIEISKKTFLLAEFVYSPDISPYPVTIGNIIGNTYDYRNFSYEFKVGIKFDR
jgi:opacity protein-like surface antigen